MTRGFVALELLMMVNSYQLSISPELELFRPEIEYACDFIDYCHGLERKKESKKILHYGEKPLDGAISIPASLFQNSVIINENGISLDLSSFSKIESKLLPNKQGKPVAYDAIGLIFFLLSRIEENKSNDRDQYNRYSFSADYVVRNNYYGKPLADIAAYDVASTLANGRPVNCATKFNIRLTHDVDRLCGYHNFFSPIKTSIADVVKGRGLKVAYNRLKNSYFTGEPSKSFEQLMRLAEESNLSARFYFMGPSNDSNDSPYALNKTRLLRKMADQVCSRGHSVGFHPGYSTYIEPDIWKKQRNGLEQIIDTPVKEGRQHMLRYDVMKTPSIWEDAGMQQDFTLAYPEQSGFRNGTCRLFEPYNLSIRKPFLFKQGSTAIMDFSFFGNKYRDMEIEEALEECNSIINICRHYGGELVILYHTGQTSGKVFQFYKELLSILH
jgi:uncharacterized protein DUF7033